MHNLINDSTLDTVEIAKFEAMASEWWNKNGKFKPLHQLNPTRLSYICDNIMAAFHLDPNKDKPLQGLRILDIGCGGGLLSEPLTQLGAEVVGADAAINNISVARLHARQSGLRIDYRHTLAEDLVKQGESFDVIINMEVIEHVADPRVLIKHCHTLLNKGGLMICSTINRTMKSYLLAIIGAEWVMRWLPVGTHQWRKFITPKELQAMVRQSQLTLLNAKGFSFNPLLWRWSINEYDLSVNYVVSISKK